MRANFTVLVLLFTLPLAGLANEQKRYHGRGGITVVGIGEVTATPDTVDFSVGAFTEDGSASHALEANNRIVSDLQEVLRAFEIPKRDV